MDKNKQKKLLAKWVNATQMIEGKDKNTYIVLRPPNELPDLKPMNGPIELDYSIYPKIKKVMNHNKINESGYNEAPNFGPSPNNPPIAKLSFRERCRLGNYTPFNIEHLAGRLGYVLQDGITQEQFEEFHHTVLDAIKIPRYV